MNVAKSPRGTIARPILLMQAEPRQVVTANRAACDLFEKDRTRMEGARGGQVFGCIHSFSEDGCGQDSNCDDCRIKAAVVDSFTTGEPHEEVRTVLEIKRNDVVAAYDIDVTTQKIGEFVMLTVNRFRKKA